jgi:hypothetical protein
MKQDSSQLSESRKLPPLFIVVPNIAVESVFNEKTDFNVNICFAFYLFDGNLLPRELLQVSEMKRVDLFCRYRIRKPATEIGL